VLTDDLLVLARDAATAAGQLLLDGQAGVTVSGTKSSPTDVVTRMDTAAEDLLRALLLGQRPEDAFLGEEQGESPGRSNVRWVVDPLDGTVNYLYGLPGWAVSVAAEVDGEVVLGVVDVPTWRSQFWATRGGGAYLDGVRLAASDAVELSQALVGTGFGYDVDRRAEQARAVQILLAQVRDIRRFGAAAADLCLLAAGRVDAYYERGPAEWDRAAGLLIAVEAGARVELRPDAARGDLVLGAAPGLFDAFRELLDRVDA
jgi:myo-inositol-1(or 4)-monophosphatase